MWHRLRPVAAALILVGLVALIAPQWFTAAFDLSKDYSGLAQIEGPLTLQLAVSPTIATPGQIITVDLQLTNRIDLSAAPSITLALPEGLSLSTADLPTGTTINLQTNALNWQPVLPAQGDVRQMRVQLRLERVDIAQPEHQIGVELHDGKAVHQAAVDVWLGIEPQIESVLSPPQAAVGQPIQLRASVLGSGPLHQTWSLGDGRSLTIADPVVVYPAPGIYQIKLDAANPLAVDSASKSITIVPHPAAQFTIDDFTPSVGQEINFLSQSGGSLPLNNSWDFGDGTSSSEANPAHIYDQAGAYQVRLTVSNQFGQSEAYWPVMVGLPPAADMTLVDTVPTGIAAAGEAFGDESVLSFQWDMGDGKQYENAQVSHVYRRVGDYFVSMTASNEFGSTQMGRWLQVTQGMEWVYLPLVLNPAQLAAGGAQFDPLVDPLGVTLDPVELSEPFVMQPIDIPEGTSLAGQLFIYINEARRQFDLPPLANVGTLNVAAQQHTGDMAAYAYTAHQGADGSYPVERLLWLDYSHGYAGEATAWGFQYPYEAVEFWVNSPAHRRIILNQFATDVGTGYTVNYNAPNVWYWTAEFGNAYGQPIAPVLRLDEPLAEQMPDARLGSAGLRTISDATTYTWNWPVKLADGQRFALYLYVNGQPQPMSFVTQPLLDTRFGAQVAAYPVALDYQPNLKLYQWQVKLLGGGGQVLAQSERRPLLLAPDPDLPAPTPVVTATPLPTATPGPVMTATPMPIQPLPTARPTQAPPPVLITATPAANSGN